MRAYFCDDSVTQHSVVRVDGAHAFQPSSPRSAAGSEAAL